MRLPQKTREPRDVVLVVKGAIDGALGGTCLARDRETGYLFRAGHARSLTDTVLELLANRDHWPEIKDAGRAFVETERNWRASVSRYPAVYGAALRRVGHG